jgi:erythromycin esterase-like protein
VFRFSAPHTGQCDLLQRDAHVFHPDIRLTLLLDEIGDTSLLLLGEATHHGTHEFYRIRAEMTKRLISECCFDVIAVEADWPDTLRANRYIRHADAGNSESGISAAYAALDDFVRSPPWMWRNTEALELVDWLHAYNAQIPNAEARASFFWSEVIQSAQLDAGGHSLSDASRSASGGTSARYNYFDHLADEPQRYRYVASFGLKKNGEDEVVRELTELSTRRCAAASVCGDVCAVATRKIAALAT